MLLGDVGSPYLAFVWFVVVRLESGGGSVVVVGSAAAVAVAADVGDEFGGSGAVVGGCFGV